MHERTEQRENKEVSRWMSDTKHRITYTGRRVDSLELRMAGSDQANRSQSYRTFYLRHRYSRQMS
jgi:hypothetical protein